MSENLRDSSVFYQKKNPNHIVDFHKTFIPLSRMELGSKNKQMLLNARSYFNHKEALQTYEADPAKTSS